MLVNVAGLVVRKGPLETDADDWDRTFALNVRAPFLLSQAVGRTMLERGEGRIVNVTSAAGLVTTTRGSVSYAASKAALSHMTRILAARWAPAVRVNAVAPGYVRTDFTAGWLDEPDNRDFVAGRTALDGLATPDDVAAAVLHLCGPGGRFVTGQELRVDGGWDV